MNDAPPKNRFWTPPRTVRFPAPSGVSALFFLYKDPRPSRLEALGGVQNFSGERVLWYVFLPPYVLHPPISRPNNLRNSQCPTRATALLISGVSALSLILFSLFSAPTEGQQLHSSLVNCSTSHTLTLQPLLFFRN